MFVSDHFLDSFGILDSTVYLLREIWRVLLQTTPLSCGWRRDCIQCCWVPFQLPTWPDRMLAGIVCGFIWKAGCCFLRCEFFGFVASRGEKSSHLTCGSSRKYSMKVEKNLDYSELKQHQNLQYRDSIWFPWCAAFKTLVFSWSASRSALLYKCFLQVRNPQWRPVNPICKSSCSATAKRLKPKKLSATTCSWCRVFDLAMRKSQQVLLIWEDIYKASLELSDQIIHQRIWNIPFLFLFYDITIEFPLTLQKNIRAQKHLQSVDLWVNGGESHTFKSPGRGPGKRLRAGRSAPKKSTAKRGCLEDTNGFWSSKNTLALDLYIFASRNW